MGLFDFLSKLVIKVKKPISQNAGAKLTTVDKERIMVRRVTTRDMVQFTSMPYHLDCVVKKHDTPRSHPFAYIELDSKNIAVAELELEILNKHLSVAHQICKKVPKGISIPVKDIVYRPSKYYGCTRLICTPHTFTGRVSKYPLSLQFTTDMSKTGLNTTHGEIFYGQNGTIQKAVVYCWRNHKGYFFYFKIENSTLVLSKIERVNTTVDSKLTCNNTQIVLSYANNREIIYQRSTP